MHIVTDKKSNVVLSVGTLKEYWANGYPVLTDQNGNDCAFVADDTNVYEVANREEVTPGEYCYTAELGFFENPDYNEPNPYGLPEELVQQIKDDAIAEVESEVAAHGTN